MNTLRDYRFKALRALGFAGATSDMMEHWHLAGGGVRGDEFGSLFCSHLGALGVTKGSFYDMWYGYLGSLGYVGTIHDRETEYWRELT